jgi:hypothetical protein
MSTYAIRERECIHRRPGADGMFYEGTAYVQSIQRLRAGEAVNVARNVTSFFWSDAAHIIVWLCRDCASGLSLQRHGAASTA